MPTHDRSNLFRVTLRSSLAQRAVALGVIVVDDGTTVSAREWLEVRTTSDVGMAAR
jgi:hypothetical protein